MSSVGSIDPEGIWYGLTMNAWIPSARPSARATIRTSSTNAPPVLSGLGTFSLLPFAFRILLVGGRAPPAASSSSVRLKLFLVGLVGL